MTDGPRPPTAETGDAPLCENLSPFRRPLVEGSVPCFRGHLRPALVAFGVFAVVFLVHVFSKVRHQADSILTIPRAMSILTEGNTDVDEYAPLLAIHPRQYMLETVDGRTYCMYPIGPSLIALPFVAVADAFWKSPDGQSYREFLKTNIASRLEEIIASLCVAAACLFVYLAVRRRTGREWPALLVVFVLAFSTTAWSTASRALWQHGPSMMFLSVALYLLVVAETRPAAAPQSGEALRGCPAAVQFVSLPLAAAYVCRPTNSIPILVITALVLWKYRRWLVRYLLWSLPVAVPFVLFNLNLYGRMLSPYYTPHAMLIQSSFWTAFLGQMVSPARGLLVFSPVFLLVAVGVGIKWKEKRLDALDLALGLIVVGHWIAISKMGWAWWAGDSFGPRFFTDVLPFLVWFLVPVVQKIARPSRSAQGSDARPLTVARIVLAVAFFLLTAAGVAIHYRGANHHAVIAWNAIPVNVNLPENRWRLWDWSDLQFLRTDRR